MKITTDFRDDFNKNVTNNQYFSFHFIEINYFNICIKSVSNRKHHEFE